MEFYSELPYEDFSYYNTPSTHEVGGSILTGIFDVLPDHITGWTDRCGRKLYFPRNRNVQHGKKRRNGLSMAGVLYHLPERTFRESLAERYI